MQGQLLGKRVAQFRIVLDNENLTRIRHPIGSPQTAIARPGFLAAFCRGVSGEVEHSLAKEQAARGRSGRS
jgi:hypothetical protein